MEIVNINKINMKGLQKSAFIITLVFLVVLVSNGNSQTLSDRELDSLLSTITNDKPLTQPTLSRNEELMKQINNLICGVNCNHCGTHCKMWSIYENTIDVNYGCGSCGHGSWEIGSVSYEIKYELKTARITGEKYKGYSLVITCNDGVKCISGGLDYTQNTGIYGDPWKELKINIRDQAIGYQIIDLLNQLEAIEHHTINEIVSIFNLGNLLGNFFTDYELKGSESSYTNEFIIEAKIDYNPTNLKFDDYAVSQNIFNQEIVKRSFKFESYTYQDVLCSAGINRIKIILIGPSGDFEVNMFYLSCN